MRNAAYLNVANDGHDSGAVVGELLQVVVDDSVKPDPQLGQDDLDVLPVQRLSDLDQLGSKQRTFS